MAAEDLTNLASQFPRRYVREDTDVGQWERIEPYFDELDQRLIDSRTALEKWLLDVSELAAVVEEEETSRYVAMTCQTDDPQRERRYLDFIENVKPKCEPRWHKLNVRYVDCVHRAGLPRRRYQVLDRNVANRVAIFREENVSLQTEDEKLQQQYDKTCGAMTVEYDGREQTLQQMARYLDEPDRQVRQETWEPVAQRRLRDRDRIEEIFGGMIRLRDQIGRNADFENYRDYAFRERERFDYTPDDCERFWDAIEQIVVPAFRAIQQERRKILKVDRLRPWDLSVDPYGRPALRPFQTGEELSGKCSAALSRLDRGLGGQFDWMRSAGMLDLESRKGKRPGGYQATFEHRREPFIFMNAAGRHDDVETLLHEAGHAFHTFALRHEPLLEYRGPPLEFCEVASMSMELLGLPYCDSFYNGQDLRRARREHLEGVVTILPWIATIDAFQHWLYTHPDHSPEQRVGCWLDLRSRFGGIDDWSGYEQELAYLWHRQSHLFCSPFYYVEYGIAQLGALQVWQNARADPAKAMTDYRAALALGGSRPLPELFNAAGIRFDFSAATLAPLVAAVQDELAGLGDRPA